MPASSNTRLSRCYLNVKCNPRCYWHEKSERVWGKWILNEAVSFGFIVASRGVRAQRHVLSYGLRMARSSALNRQFGSIRFGPIPTLTLVANLKQTARLGKGRLERSKTRYACLGKRDSS